MTLRVDTSNPKVHVSVGRTISTGEKFEFFRIDIGADFVLDGPNPTDDQIRQRIQRACVIMDEELNKALD